ncbi:MAG: hypothetical protein Fur0040_05370 [Sideroxydans sp.]
MCACGDQLCSEVSAADVFIERGLDVGVDMAGEVDAGHDQVFDIWTVFDTTFVIKSMFDVVERIVVQGGLLSDWVSQERRISIHCKKVSAPDWMGIIP